MTNQPPARHFVLTEGQEILRVEHGLPISTVPDDAAKAIVVAFEHFGTEVVVVVTTARGFASRPLRPHCYVAIIPKPGHIIPILALGVPVAGTLRFARCVRARGDHRSKALSLLSSAGDCAVFRRFSSHALQRFAERAPHAVVNPDYLLSESVWVRQTVSASAPEGGFLAVTVSPSLFYGSQTYAVLPVSHDGVIKTFLTSCMQLCKIDEKAVACAVRLLGIHPSRSPASTGERSERDNSTWKSFPRVGRHALNNYKWHHNGFFDRRRDANTTASVRPLRIECPAQPLIELSQPWHFIRTPWQTELLRQHYLRQRKQPCKAAFKLAPVRVQTASAKSGTKGKSNSKKQQQQTAASTTQKGTSKSSKRRQKKRQVNIQQQQQQKLLKRMPPPRQPLKQPESRRLLHVRPPLP